MFSIIIPFFNEEENLPTLIKHLIEVCEKAGKEFEIVLVDDGSDDTSVAISNFQFLLRQAQDPEQSRGTISKKIKLIKHKKRLGKGEALNTGVKNAEVARKICK